MNDHYWNQTMKIFSRIMASAVFLGVAALSQADGHSDHHDAAPTVLRYAEFNQIGNPADVLNEIAPNDSGSSHSPSPKKHQILRSR